LNREEGTRDRVDSGGTKGKKKRGSDRKLTIETNDVIAQGYYYFVRRESEGGKEVKKAMAEKNKREREREKLVMYRREF